MAIDKFRYPPLNVFAHIFPTFRRLYLVLLLRGYNSTRALIGY